MVLAKENYEKVKKVVKDNLLKIEDNDYFADCLNEFLNVACNDKIRSKHDYYHGDVYDKPYNSPAEFVHDKRNSPLYVGSDGYYIADDLEKYKLCDDFNFYYCEANNFAGERQCCTYVCIRKEDILKKVSLDFECLSAVAEDNEELFEELTKGYVEEETKVKSDSADEELEEGISR